ncbi:hypothetical protein MHJ85_09550 [Brevibacterium ravenspurgense]|uniref:hypothetical protein n=1 Tax=Brevibacterium ravenspurgense TaxID=479117 RepID=UPI001EF3176C|nr:hypothetical protein [Brevibacterium ravenspurgense]MCG7301497.1 hypothetical protein [Brevibacterium ravenspurgense]
MKSGRPDAAAEAPLNRRHRLIFAAAALIGAVLSWLLYAAMAPGGFTKDTVFQLEQAQRAIPFNDWHPIAMTWTWQWLIDLTGTINSMLFLQACAAWVCAVLTSYYLLKVSRRGWSALAGLFILFLPNTVNLVGVVWKDTHLGLALYFAVILVLLIPVVPKLRWVFAALAFGALVYAGLVRKNSAVSVVPIIAVMTVWLVSRMKSKKQAEEKRGLSKRCKLITVVVAVVCFGAVLTGVETGMKAALKPTENSQYTQVMLDDLIFAVPQAAIDAADAPAAEKTRLAQAKITCGDKNNERRKAGSPEIIWDGYWACYGRGAEGDYTEIEDPEAVTSIWKQTVPRHLDSYAAYRVRTTTKFLFTSKLEFVRDRNYDYPAQSQELRSSLRTYVVDFGVAVLPWLYLGATALGMCAVGIAVGVKKKRRSLGALAIFSSAVLYLMTYVTTAPANDYRYVFWPWLAALLGWLVLWAENQRRRKR